MIWDTLGIRTPFLHSFLYINTGIKMWPNALSELRMKNGVYSFCSALCSERAEQRGETDSFAILSLNANIADGRAMIRFFSSNLNLSQQGGLNGSDWQESLSFLIIIADQSTYN